MTRVESLKVAFVGGGNMATALIGGLIKAGAEPGSISVCDPDPAARERLDEDHGVICHATARPALERADLVVLAVKPQVMPAALDELAGIVSAGHVVISVAAGITVQTIRDRLGTDIPVIRTMPNTPALVGAGVTGMYAGPGCGDADRSAAELVMRSAGSVVWVADEALMNVVTAISGSGPAYYFLMTEALQAAGSELGLPVDAARDLATHTAHGSGVLLLQTGLQAAELRRRVTSPGGTTEAAVDVLQGAELRGLVIDAVRAAVQRGEQLATGGDEK